MTRGDLGTVAGVGRAGRRAVRCRRPSAVNLTYLVGIVNMAIGARAAPRGRSAGQRGAEHPEAMGAVAPELVDEAVLPVEVGLHHGRCDGRPDVRAHVHVVGWRRPAPVDPAVGQPPAGRPPGVGAAGEDARSRAATCSRLGSGERGHRAVLADDDGVVERRRGDELAARRPDGTRDVGGGVGRAERHVDDRAGAGARARRRRPTPRRAARRVRDGGGPGRAAPPSAHGRPSPSGPATPRSVCARAPRSSNRTTTAPRTGATASVSCTSWPPGTQRNPAGWPVTCSSRERTSMR